MTKKEQLTCGNDFVIVYHTKTYKDRYFSLTNDLKCYFRRLKEMQDNYYPNSKYLFPADTDNGVITNRAVYFVYHMASALFGNSPEVAKQNYFTGIDMSVATDVLNKSKHLQKTKNIGSAVKSTLPTLLC